MPYPQDTAPAVKGYTLVKRPRLAGKIYVLATPDGKPITKVVNLPPIPGYTSDPRVDGRTMPVLSVSVLDSMGDEKAVDQITKGLERIDHNATVEAEVRGEDYTWLVSSNKVELQDREDLDQT